MLAEVSNHLLATIALVLVIVVCVVWLFSRR